MSRRFVFLASLAVAVIAAGAPVLGATALVPWGGENPGKASDHARVAQPALDHNQALSEHPPVIEAVPSPLGMPEALPEQANEHAQDNFPPETGMPDALPEQANDHADEHFPPAGGPPDEGGDASSDAAGAGASAPRQSMAHDWANFSANGSIGSGTWNFSNLTLNVTGGNFSWHGINCTWGDFSWQKGMNFSDVLNITCDFWGLFTVTVNHGEINITWSSGSWNHTFDAPPAPQPMQPHLETQGVLQSAVAAPRSSGTRLGSFGLPA